MNNIQYSQMLRLSGSIVNRDLYAEYFETIFSALNISYIFTDDTN